MTDVPSLCKCDVVVPFEYDSGIDSEHGRRGGGKGSSVAVLGAQENSHTLNGQVSFTERMPSDKR